jgi:hypothetical protein
MANSREEIKETQMLNSVKHYYNITRISLQINNISKRQLKAGVLKARKVRETEWN